MRQKRIKTTMQTREGEIGLAIYGGAGTIARSKMTPEMERELRAGLQRAHDAGHEILKNGGSSLDAVDASVRAMEDDPLFNAGKGGFYQRRHARDGRGHHGRSDVKGRSGGGT
jgi:beta-aspartyl-peptidase (threonine type)